MVSPTKSRIPLYLMLYIKQYKAQSTPYRSWAISSVVNAPSPHPLYW